MTTKIVSGVWLGLFILLHTHSGVRHALGQSVDAGGGDGASAMVTDVCGGGGGDGSAATAADGGDALADLRAKCAKQVGAQVTPLKAKWDKTYADKETELRRIAATDAVVAQFCGVESAPAASADANNAPAAKVDAGGGALAAIRAQCIKQVGAQVRQLKSKWEKAYADKAKALSKLAAKAAKQAAQMCANSAKKNGKCPTATTTPAAPVENSSV